MVLIGRRAVSCARTCILLLAVVAATAGVLECGSLQAQEQIDEVTVSSPEAVLQSAIVAAGAGDFSKAAALLDTLLVDSSFSKMDSPAQFRLLLTSAAVASESQQYVRALDLARRATELMPDEASGWLVRVQVGLKSKDYSEAARSLARMLRLSPSTSVLDRQAVVQLCSLALRLPDTGAAYELLKALNEGNWAQVPDQAVTEFRYTLARLALDRSDAELAGRVAADVSGLEYLLRMRVDARFASIVAADPKRFDVEQAAAADVARLGDLAVQNSRSLAAVISLSHALQVSRDCGGALRLLDATLLKWRNQGVGAAFDDSGKVPWIMNARADMLICLGQWDAAVEQLREASLQKEHGRTNVSQVLNLADLYVQLKRPTEALKLLDASRDMALSEYGLASIESVRHSAAVQTRNAAESRRSREYLAQHQGVASHAYRRALIEDGLLDEAADSLIANLTSPERRSQALMEMQDFAEMPLPPFAVEMDKRFTAFSQRVDVRQAIARYGHTEHFTIYSPLSF